MAKENKKKKAADEKKDKKKNVIVRVVEKLKKPAAKAMQKIAAPVRKKKAADNDKSAAPVKTIAKAAAKPAKAGKILGKKKAAVPPAPAKRKKFPVTVSTKTKAAAPRDPVIIAPADDVDASQSAKFTVNAADAQPKKTPRKKVPEYENLGELPEAYGTKKLYLAARDPHWLYAYWDLTPDQIGAAERQAHDGKVFLQIYTADGERLQQIHISPWTREWYIGAHRPDQTFFAEVGYYRHDGRFEVVTRSAPVTSPRAGLSWRTEARFATLPFNLSFRELAALISLHAQPDEEVAETLARLQSDGFPLPFSAGADIQPGDDAHGALLDYINGDLTRRIRMGSDEIVETVSGRQRDTAGAGLDLAELSSLGGSSFSSPHGGYGAERGFHAHVNAELIIYGGTAPDAKVRVAGQEIKLSASGGFHYHFNFQNGKYHIPIEFTSADGQETRSAMLSFLRVTDKRGKVTDTPQPPRAEPLGKLE